MMNDDVSANKLNQADLERNIIDYVARQEKLKDQISSAKDNVKSLNEELKHIVKDIANTNDMLNAIKAEKSSVGNGFIVNDILKIV